MQKILIVDDDLSFGMMVEGFLKRHSFEVTLAASFGKAESAVKSTLFDLVLTDYRLPDGTGMDVLQTVKKRNPATSVVLITAYSDIRVAVDAIKSGAFEYITKPVNPEELLHVIKEASRQEQKMGKAKPGSTALYIAGTGTETNQLEAHISVVAPTDLAVLIQGESGTGKEFVARRIHELSKRHNEPFVAVDCGALTPEIASSELFGHIKGSFTGAITDKKGQFEAVGKGTIFLDEIGNLSYDVQVKLLRALQEKRARPVGSNHEFNIEARIITASNDDLRSDAMEGKFREDLYHRLNEFTVVLPPLRERGYDLERFAEHFLKLAAEEFNKGSYTFSDEVLHIFKTYEWPGNVRELKNVVRRAVLLSNQKVIGPETIPEEIKESIDKRTPTEMGTKPLEEAKNQSEREVILEILEQTRYNKTRTAELLGIDRKTLYNKLQKYNIAY